MNLRRFSLVLILCVCACSDTVGTSNPWDFSSPIDVMDLSSHDMQLDPTQEELFDGASLCPVHPQGAVAFAPEGIDYDEGERFCSNSVYYEVGGWNEETEEREFIQIADDCCGREIRDVQINSFAVETLEYEHENPLGPQYPQDFAPEDCRQDFAAQFQGKPTIEQCADCANVVKWEIEVSIELENTGNVMLDAFCDFNVVFPNQPEKPYSVQVSKSWPVVEPGQKVQHTAVLNSIYWGCGIEVLVQCGGALEPKALDYRPTGPQLSGEDVELLEHANIRASYFYPPQ